MDLTSREGMLECLYALTKRAAPIIALEILAPIGYVVYMDAQELITLKPVPLGVIPNRVQAMALLHNLVERYHGLGSILVGESWVVMRSDGSIVPENHPDKISAIIAALDDKRFGRMVLCTEIDDTVRPRILKTPRLVEGEMLGRFYAN